jgi:urease accessory protein
VTRLSERSHRGPLLVQRPFYPEGGLAHVYLLHPPGGVVGGDRLSLEVQCDEAEALLTTPAAGKFYRSGGERARQTVSLRVQGGSLEWLPQETILFDGAQVESTLSVDLRDGGRFIGWETVCLGRPAAGERFSTGAGDFRLQIRQDGETLLLERFRIDERFLRAGWGMRGNASFGSLWAYPSDREVLGEVQALIADRPLLGATLVDGLLAVRGLGTAEELRKLLIEVWRCVRLAVIGRPACLPRIWAT